MVTSPLMMFRAIISIMPTSEFDLIFMREAIALSVSSVEAGGGPFGAIIVREQQIIGRGQNRVTIDIDPTAHAEVVAIREACRTIGNFSLDGCVIYASCHPCPMCLSAICWARLDAVVFGNTADDAAAIGFDDRKIYDALQNSTLDALVPMVPLLRDEALEAFRRWEAKPDRVAY